MVDLNALTAAHRFGLGARFGELDTIAPDPKTWLNAQLTDVSSTLDTFGLMSSVEAVTLFFDYLRTKREEKKAAAAATFGTQSKTAKSTNKERLLAFASTIDEIKSTEQMARQSAKDISGLAKAASDASKAKTVKTSQDLLQDMYKSLIDDVSVRTLHATLTPASFRERLVRFWSDHFSVDFDKSLITVPTAITMEREAIRPHVTGKFYDMLVAVESHQGMLIYLDNWTSIGPNSWAGQEFNLGLNENLARETLELHTLGVGGGYSQDDIIEYAKAITGWTMGNLNFNEDSLGAFVYQPLFHEPGTRTIMGKSYPDTGMNQALNALQDFVRHPSTAKHIARKLAFHFHSDTPPQSLIDKLAQVFTDTDGDLLQVSLALVGADEMWDGQFLKLRNSEEFLLASYRAFDLSNLAPDETFNVFELMGQVPFTAGSPAGWPDDEASWASSSTIAARLNLSVLIGNLIDNVPLPPDYANDLVGPILSTNSTQILSGAFTKAQGYALMLMTPEMQRR
ncbi:MAG: hypothetical protein COA84_09745 [Robiginitomaculum sp.]|nr:MAG: hypothetical protein COA84_09745 [Robiginitomaculum sp.]